ncbi:MAG: hypothetical protein KDI01_05325 [Halioglobus sp.]|nr:hypothetical protein [Halioglobus sp.]
MAAPGMSARDLQLTHIALVGARMSAFKSYGFIERNQLALRRVAPDTGEHPLASLPASQLHAALAAQLPIWVHNIIADPDFPQRHKLVMPLRRFEGELLDNRNNEVVACVLNAGFRNQTLDPLHLPDTMPLRQRCALVMHIGVWQDAYRALEGEVVALLALHVDEVTRWVARCREPGYANIE